MPNDPNNLLSLQQQFNQLGVDKLGSGGKEPNSSRPNQEWGAQKNPGTFDKRRNTTQPGSQSGRYLDQKRRSGSKIGMGSRLASQDSQGADSPRGFLPSRISHAKDKGQDTLSRLSYLNESNSMGRKRDSVASDRSAETRDVINYRNSAVSPRGQLTKNRVQKGFDPSFQDAWNKVPQQLEKALQNPQSVDRRDNPYSPPYLKPNQRGPYNTGQKFSHVDEQQRKLDEQLLFNSQRQRRDSDAQNRFQPQPWVQRHMTQQPQTTKSQANPIIDLTGRKQSYQNLGANRRNVFDDQFDRRFVKQYDELDQQFRNLNPNEDDVQDQVDRVWHQFDRDRNGYLDMNETYAFLRNFLSKQGIDVPTMQVFTRFFEEFDVNQDGYISKPEMASFFRKFLRNKAEAQNDQVHQIVNRIWYKYDIDRSGYLDRRETFRFVQDVLAQEKRPPPTMLQFNRFFDQYDRNGDGAISKSEMAVFVRNFFQAKERQQSPKRRMQPFNTSPRKGFDPIDDMVQRIFDKFDANGNGFLEKRETLNLLNEILKNRGQPPATLSMFNRFFNKIDLNGDGSISRREMTQFVKQFLEDDVVDTRQPDIGKIVQQVWFQYDVDRSGYLDKRETLRFLNDILAQQGRQQATLSMFNRFYAEFDLNGDGRISKTEMARFLRKFMGLEERPKLRQIRDNFEDDVASKVHAIWYKYDTDRSGYLDRRETYRFLNDLLQAQGKPQASLKQFNTFFNEIDVNRDETISKAEMAKFVRKFLNSEQDEIEEMVHKIFMKFDANGNGFLDKRETYRLLDQILAQRGEPPATREEINSFFAEFDVNGDGVLSKREVSAFVKKFLRGNKPILQQDEDRVIAELVQKAWYKYDRDRSGFLDKRETLRFLDDFLAQRGLPPCSTQQFNRFFAEFDINCDECISKSEMARFFKMFTDIPSSQHGQDDVVETVNNIWLRYDTDRSGTLDRRETLRFVNDFLAQRGQPPATVPQFSRFFDQFDVNGDGVLTKVEMAKFVRLFLKDDQDRMIEDVVKNLFLKFDTNRSGFLEKRETLKLLDEILAQKGQPPTSLPQFNRFYSEFDLNGDGLISLIEMSKFVRKFLDPSSSSPKRVSQQAQGLSQTQSTMFGTRSNSFMAPNSLRKKTPLRANRNELNRSISATRHQANQSHASRLNPSEFGYESSVPGSRQFNPSNMIERSPFLDESRQGPFNDSYDKSKNSTNVKNFFDEFNRMISEAQETNTPLKLLSALELLFFLDKKMLGIFDDRQGHIRYSSIHETLNDQKNNIIIHSNDNPGQPHIQQNLFKICCAILNLKPGQRGHQVLDESLLIQYLDQIDILRFEDDENLQIQIAVIKNLINRRAFSLNDTQIKLIHTKFQNMYLHRLQYFGGPKMSVPRLPTDLLSNTMGNDNISNVFNQDPFQGAATQRVPATEMRRKLDDLNQQDPWSIPKKSPTAFNDLNDSYTADFRPKKSSQKKQRGNNREPICVLKVELDGDHKEKIKVYEGEDPEIIVDKFGDQHNLSDNAKKRLLKQIKQQMNQY